MELAWRHRLMQRGYLTLARLTRGMTLGVRGMLLTDDTVVLVKHSYIPGWHFPGGGVEAGETLIDALARELREEAGAVLTGRPQLLAVYRHRRVLSDHIALFVCREWEVAEAPKLPNGEIVGCERVPLKRLPADTSPATRARIGEVLEGLPPSPDW